MKNVKLNKSLLAYIPLPKCESPENNTQMTPHAIICKIHKKNTIGIQTDSKKGTIEKSSKSLSKITPFYTKDSSHHFKKVNYELGFLHTTRIQNRKTPKKVTKAEYFRGLVMTPHLHMFSSQLENIKAHANILKDSLDNTSILKSNSHHHIKHEVRSLSPLIYHETSSILNRNLNSSEKIKYISSRPNLPIRSSPRCYKRLDRLRNSRQAEKLLKLHNESFENISY